MNTDGTSQDTGSNGLSEHQAAERIAALLTPEGDSDGGETPNPSQDEADDPEDEDDEAQAEADDSEEQSEGEEETGEEAPEPRTYTVKVDGEEVQVTEDELLRGYSRTQDYTRKTMELAEARKALEPELQALRQEREQYANLLPQLFAKLNETAQSPELEHLRQTDPGEWAARMREIERQEAAIRSEYERVTKQQAEEAEKERRHRGQEEAQALLKAEPKFAERGVFEDVKAYGLQSGFDPSDLDDNLDHRAWIVLHKAMQFDRLKAKAPEVKAKVEAVKSAKPGAAQRQPSKVTELTRAKQRLAKTGRVEDAQAAIERMLGL